MSSATPKGNTKLNANNSKSDCKIDGLGAVTLSAIPSPTIPNQTENALKI